MIKVNVIIQDSNWKKYIKRPKAYLNKKIEILSKKDKFLKKKNIEVSILLSGNKKIKKLNKQFRKKNKSTDVLSFPSYEGQDFKKNIKKKIVYYLGDIIINVNKIKEKKNNHTFKKNFDILWIHGLIHLLGHRHKRKSDFLNMQKVENKFYNLINE